MPGKHVHFASEAYPDTPSPTFSSMSFTSSGGPRTPVSTTSSLPASTPPNLAAYVLARVHPVLGITQQSPMLEYDVSCPTSTIRPNLSTVPQHVLDEPATHPPVPSMIIRCARLPWKITVQPTNTKHVTVRDVFDGIYRSLRLSALEAEFQCLPSVAAKQAVTNAYVGRYKLIDNPEARQHEKTKGLRRVDFLAERTRFTGLSSTSEGPHVWSLTVS